MGSGGPLPGPESGLLSNTQKCIVRRDTLADKAGDFIGKGRPGGEQQGHGTQQNAVPQGSQSWVLCNEVCFQVVSGPSL